MFIRFITFVFALFVSQFSLASIEGKNIANDIRFPVSKFKLKNGLTLLVHQDFTTPLVSFHAWFRVGSRHEKPGMTGIAHFFEHLMFKGSKNYPPSSFDNLIQANGGTNNAFTTYDYTGYYVDLPADKLEIILKMESDRMVNLLFDPLTIKSEREVVKEERRYRYDNSVSGYLNEAVFSSVFKVHPYRWPVIGYMRDLNAIQIDQFKKFYRTYYSPNNAVIVIVGSVDTKDVKSKIEKYFGGLEAQEIPLDNLPPEPEQKQQRNQTLLKDVANPYVAIAYKSVPAGHKDQYAFDLLSNILSEGSSSRLYQRLVYKEQLVSSVNSWAYTPKDAGVFEVDMSVKPNKDVEKAITSVFGELYKLRMTEVSDKELDKAKNQVMKSYVDSMKTVSGKARLLASNEILFGNYEVLFEDLDSYMAVTKAQIKEVANKYLLPTQRSVIRVLPKNSNSQGE